MMETPEGRKDFNERTGRAKFWEKKDLELLAMLDKNVGRIGEKYVTWRGSCPCCGKSPPKQKLLWHKEGLRYVRCADCGMVFIDPILKPEVLDRIYDSAESSKLWLEVEQKQENLDLEKFKNIVDSIIVYQEDVGLVGGTVLDVGASYGFFLHIAQRMGYKGVGLELCTPAIELGRRRFPDVELRAEKLESWVVGREESVDVVTFLEVLEHIPDPNEILECARAVLKPDGLLVALVPNLEAKTNLILHEKSKTFGANHLNYWSWSTLTKQLNRAGLSVEETSTIIGDTNTWWNYINYEDPYAGNLVHPDHADATMDALRHGQGYKLLAVARKK